MGFLLVSFSIVALNIVVGILGDCRHVREREVRERDNDRRLIREAMDMLTDEELMERMAWNA